MAGHSHWANIQQKKSRIDKKRGKLFTKLSRAIIVAAQLGGSDPDTNLALRYAVDKARKASMPNDNIARAIKRGCGEIGGDKYEEVLYEGYGPSGVAVLCEILTENRNRTAGEVRKIFEVHGGNLGATGCVAWMFDHKSLFSLPVSATTEDQLFDVVADAGAEDIQAEDEQFVVTAAVDVFDAVNKAIEEAGLTTTSAEITRVPQNYVELDSSNARRVLRLMEALDDNDDIQDVTANFSLPDDVMKAVLEAD
jgi:YebC/PmpR family DNA-binding regulatory protein